MAPSHVVMLILLILAMAAPLPSSGTWCICKGGLSDAVLQKTLDYACGAGADCNPTHQAAPCFNPNTVRAHCNYAVNSFFQRNRQASTACDFSGTASLVTSDPSTAGCSYPATASSTSTTPVGTTPMTPGSGTLNGGSPLVTTTTPNGALGGTTTGLGPSGINDPNIGEVLVPKGILLCSSLILTFFKIVLRMA